MARRATAIFKIHPAFGIARVGDSADGWFIGPELPSVPPLPDAGRGGEGFRAAGIKRQAARFRVYRYEVDEQGQLGAWRELTLDDPTVKSIEWTVHLANTKASYYQFEGALWGSCGPTMRDVFWCSEATGEVARTSAADHWSTTTSRITTDGMTMSLMDR